MTTYQAQKGQSTTFLSSALFNISLRASEEQPLAGYNSIVAVVFSAAALEAFLNDLVEHAATEAKWLTEAKAPASEVIANFSNLLTEAEKSRTDLLFKIQLARHVLTGASYATGEQPYQDLSLLVRLRNELIHLRPETVEIGAEFERTRRERITRLLRGLQARGVVGNGEDFDGFESWVHIVTQSSAAEWAHSTVIAVANDMLNAFAKKHPSTLIDHWKSQLAPIRK